MKPILIIFLLIYLNDNLYSNWKSEREALDNIYKIDEFRIFYTLIGKHKIKNQIDNNSNNIPDYIESIALQLKIANQIFNKKLMLKKPLYNYIYKNKATNIDIHMLKLKKGINGLTGDAVIKYNYHILKENNLSISIALSNNLSFTNLTPSHELFHVYQNGYSLIKNRWYTEGMARFIEEYFKEGKDTTHKILPQTKVDLNKTLLNTYSNNSFFKRLIHLCNNYFLINFLNNLTLQEIKIRKEYHLTNYNWKEKEQKNTRNNIYILRAIKNTILENKSCKKNKELLNFLKLIK